VTSGPGVRLYYGDALRRYAFEEGHPFGAARLDAFWEEVCRRGLDSLVEICPPIEAARSVLERFHSPAYLNRLHALSANGHGLLDQGDTPAFPGIFEAAAAVVGTTLAACDALMAGRCRAAFTPIAGLHHAGRGTASGFCALNDCGVAIETLKTHHKLERIAYVDIDLHHADGVFYAFEDDPAVIFADIHEDGRFIFPGSGAESERGRGVAEGTKLNVALAPSSGDRAFFAAWARVESFLDAARPQFVLFQCGADGLAGEPLGDLRYSQAAHAHATNSLMGLVERHCPGRLLAMGGGGYNLRNVAAAWCAVLEKLVGL